MTTTDEAKQVRPVMLFKNGSEAHDPDVKDFRPISEYLDNDRKTRISAEPEPNPNHHAVPDEDDLVPEPEHPQTADQPDESPEADPGIAPPEVDAPDDEEPTSPPDVAPEPESVDAETGSDEDDDIPSPWDDEDNA